MATRPTVEELDDIIHPDYPTLTRYIPCRICGESYFWPVYYYMKNGAICNRWTGHFADDESWTGICASRQGRAF